MKYMYLILLLILFVSLPVQAQIPDGQTKEILQETMTLTKDIQIPGFHFNSIAEKAATGQLRFDFSSVIQYILDLFTKETKQNISLLIKMVVLSVLAGILCNLQQAMPGDGIGEISFLACFSVIAGISVTIVTDLTQIAVETIDSLMLCMAGLMPAMGTLCTGINPIFSGFYPSLFFAMQTFVVICKNIFLPMITIITALTVINALSGRFHITRLIEFARQTVKWGLGLLLTIFVGILSIHSFTAGSVSVAGRTVKYALSNFVPLVGGVLAESAEAVLRSFKLIRSAFGISGILALLTLCCVPLAKILSSSVLYRFSAGVVEPATDKRIVSLLMDLSGNITLIFVIVLMVTVMFIISLALLCMLVT